MTSITKLTKTSIIPFTNDIFHPEDFELSEINFIKVTSDDEQICLKRTGINRWGHVRDLGWYTGKYSNKYVAELLNSFCTVEFDKISRLTVQIKSHIVYNEDIEDMYNNLYIDYNEKHEDFAVYTEYYNVKCLNGKLTVTQLKLESLLESSEEKFKQYRRDRELYMTKLNNRRLSAEEKELIKARKNEERLLKQKLIEKERIRKEKQKQEQEEKRLKREQKMKEKQLKKEQELKEKRRIEELMQNPVKFEFDNRQHF